MPGKVKGLLHWCKKVTDGYLGGEVSDMSSSWKNGLAFCAIIHRFRPDLIDYGSLSPEEVFKNNSLAFSIADSEFGIMSLLDPKDMVEMATPDRMSVATYVSQFYDHFKDEQIIEREVEYKYKPSIITANNGHAENVPENSAKDISDYVIDTNGDKDNGSHEVIHDNSLDSEISTKDLLNSQTEDQGCDFAKSTKKDSVSDIDEIYKENEILLLKRGDGETIQTERELGYEHNSSVSDQRDSIGTESDKEISLQEICKCKPDAVLKAAVCAGIAAVAITAGEETETAGEDTETADNVERLCSDTEPCVKPDTVGYTIENVQKSAGNDGKISIPEIQITLTEECRADEENIVEESVSSEGISPDLETKIKSLHEQSLASSSSESFQSADYIIVDNDSQPLHSEIYIKEKHETIDNTDQLKLVLNGDNTNTGLTHEHCKSPKAIISSSSESFTSTSSAITTDSNNSSAIDKTDGKSIETMHHQPPEVENKLAIPDKDSETELLDEEDEEPPALPAVGPPPLPECTKESAGNQEEIVIQGELEVLHAEPITIVHNEKTEIEVSEISDNKSIMEEAPASEESRVLSNQAENALPLNSVQDKNNADVHSDIVLPDQSVYVHECQLSAQTASVIECSPDVALSEDKTEKTPICSDYESIVEETERKDERVIHHVTENTLSEPCGEQSCGENISSNQVDMEVNGNESIIEKDEISSMNVNQTSLETELKSPTKAYENSIKEAPHLNIEMQQLSLCEGPKVEGAVEVSPENQIGKEENCMVENLQTYTEERDSTKVFKSGLKDGIEDLKQSNQSLPANSKHAIGKSIGETKSVATEGKNYFPQNPVKKDKYADVDINLVKKAKEMSKRMAEKQSEKQYSSISPNEERDIREAKINKDSQPKPVAKEPDAHKEKEEDKKARRMEILRQLQRSTRPTKKSLEDPEFDLVASSSDSSTGFKTKMKMWNRKSSTAQEPDEISLSSGSSTPDSTSRKSFSSITSSPVNTPTSPREEYSNLQKLTQSLPSKPRPGSVAEYVRKLSAASQGRPSEDNDVKDSAEENPSVARITKGDLRRSTSDASPVFRLSRPSRRSEPIQLSVKPLVQRYTGIEENSSPAPIVSSSPRKHSQDFSVSVKPLNEKYDLSDEDSKQKRNDDKKATLERKDSLTRRNPPKRTVSITRPRSRSSSRERNIWNYDYSSDVITSQAVEKEPTVVRRESFDVQVRPVSLQLPKEEKHNDKDQERRHSLTQAISPRKDSKVNISVQPFSPMNELNQNSTGMPERKPELNASLAPKWTSKIDTKPSSSKAEPLAITAKHPGRSVLNYVQSCMQQKTAPKSLKEKAAIFRRPATFTSSDICKPTISRKDSIPDSDQRKDSDWTEKTSSSNEPHKKDSVSICNSIFGSKSKIKLNKSKSEESKEVLHRSSEIVLEKDISPAVSQTTSSPVIQDLAQQRLVPQSENDFKFNEDVKDNDIEVKIDNVEDIKVVSNTDSGSDVGINVTDKITAGSLVADDKRKRSSSSPSESSESENEKIKPNEEPSIDPTLPDQRNASVSLISCDEESTVSAMPLVNTNISVVQSQCSESTVNIPTSDINSKEDEEKILKALPTQVCVSKKSSSSSSDSSSTESDHENNPIILNPGMDLILSDQIDSSASLGDNENTALKTEDSTVSSLPLLSTSIPAVHNQCPGINPNLHRSDDNINVAEKETPRALPSKVSTKKRKKPSSSSSDSSSTESDHETPQMIQTPSTDLTMPVQQDMEVSLAPNDKESLTLEAVDHFLSAEPVPDQRLESGPSKSENMEVAITQPLNHNVDNSLDFSETYSSSANFKDVSDVNNEVLYHVGEASAVGLENKEVYLTQSYPSHDASIICTDLIGDNMAVNKSSSENLGSINIDTPTRKNQTLLAVNIHENVTDAKITKTKSSDSDSDSDTSADETRQSLQNMSTNSTSSTSSAEIEKPELKEGLKSIILELEQEIQNDNQSNVCLQEEPVNDNNETVCIAPDTSIYEVEAGGELCPTDTLRLNVPIPDDGNCLEEVSEKDLFEDFENLVDSLKKEEEEMELAKELDVVPEDEIEEETQVEATVSIEEAVPCHIGSYKNSREETTEAYKPNNSTFDIDLKEIPVVKNEQECEPTSNENSEKTFSHTEEKAEFAPEQSVSENLQEVCIPADQKILDVVSELSNLQVSPDCDPLNIDQPKTHENDAIKENLQSSSRSSDSSKPDIKDSVKDNLQSSSTSSTSSSSSSSSSSKTGSKEIDDDELLRNVIEDSQPFRAPLLEEIIEKKNVGNTPEKENISCSPIAPCSIDKSEENENQSSKEIQENETKNDNNLSDSKNQVSVIEDNDQVSIIEDDDPIILSAVADANNIASPLEVKVSVFESGIEEPDRMSPVLFSEEEVLKQHGFDDVIYETPADDPVLFSALSDAKKEKRKAEVRKDSSSSSNGHSDAEDDSVNEGGKQFVDTNELSKIETMVDSSAASHLEKKHDVRSDSESPSSKKTTESQSSLSCEEMKDLGENNNDLETKTDEQSAQSENESEDGMKYKFKGKDGNCYLLLDNDPTSPVAKTLIAKEKAENLKNSSLSSMSDEQIQDVIDSINMKHTEYLPVSGITVSLKNPDYFFDQKFDPFTDEINDLPREFVVEDRFDTFEYKFPKSNQLEKPTQEPDSEEISSQYSEQTNGNKSCDGQTEVIQSQGPVIEADYEQSNKQLQSGEIINADPVTTAVELTGVSNMPLKPSEKSGSENSTSSSKETAVKKQRKKKKKHRKHRKSKDLVILKDESTSKKMLKSNSSSSSDSEFDRKKCSIKKKTPEIEKHVSQTVSSKVLSNDDDVDNKAIRKDEPPLLEISYEDTVISKSDIKEKDSSSSESETNIVTKVKVKKTPESEIHVPQSISVNLLLNDENKTVSRNEEMLEINNAKQLINEPDSKIEIIKKKDSSSSDSEREVKTEEKEKKTPEIKRHLPQTAGSKVLSDDDGGETIRSEEPNLLEINDEHPLISESDIKIELIKEKNRSSSESETEVETKKEKVKKKLDIEIPVPQSISVNLLSNDDDKKETRKEEPSLLDKNNDDLIVNEPDIKIRNIQEKDRDSNDSGANIETEEKVKTVGQELKENIYEDTEILPAHSDDSDSTSDSSSSSVSSESGDETDNKLVEVNTDTITLNETKSIVYHSDDELKSTNSVALPSNDRQITKDSEGESEIIPEIHVHETVNYENWPLNFKEVEDTKEEIGIDTGENEDLKKDEE